MILTTPWRFGSLVVVVVDAVVTMDTSEVWFEPGLIWANVELRWKTFSSAEVFLTMTGVDSRLREVLADPGSSENQRYKIFKSCSLFE